MPSQLIERLFDRLSAMYGARFADMWRGIDPAAMKRVWAEELSDCSREELARGVAACRTRDWPPTLPEFLKLCRPALDYERAFLEAIEQMRNRESGADAWSDPAVYWAAAHVGSDLTKYPYQAVAKRWQAALDESVRRIAAGELTRQIPPRRVALPSPGETTVSAEIAQQRIQGMRDLLARKMTAAPSKEVVA